MERVKLWMYLPNLKSVALPVPEIIAGSLLKIFGQSLDMPFKVIQGNWFCYQSKACMRLPISHLARLSNLGPVLHCFGDIAGFLRSRVTPPLFNPNQGRSYVWGNRGSRLGCFRDCCLGKTFLWLAKFNIWHSRIPIMLPKVILVTATA